jgi:thiol:disulfide interchange protein
MRSLIQSFLFLLLLFFFAFQQSQAQDSSLVKWSSGTINQANNSILIKLNGEIKDNWHVYASDSIDGLSGITFSILDSSIQIKSHEITTQSISNPDPVFERRKKETYQQKIELSILVSYRGALPEAIKIPINYELGRVDQFTTEEQVIKIVLDSSKTSNAVPRVLVSSIDVKNPKNSCGISKTEETSTSKSLLHIFLLGFLGGLVALLTPCVFPMIPLTVSFFTKKATNKKQGVSNAFLYGFFILLIYILLSLPFHFLDSVNPELLNNISTNVYLNVIFFVVFVFFAFSFFGFYEITLPSGLSTGADSKASSGNILGIFFMALTLAIVSFSCTGPILGSLLAGSLSTNGGAIQLTSGMAGFGLALALPFALFALFPHWLQSLPKSGGWLNTVKVTLGFLELALAFKFLSNADLVKHWGILKREIFIGIWIVVGIALTLYLFGKIKFSHDSPNEKIGPIRKILAVIVGLFSLYLIPGLTNTKWANLSLISGFPPPLYYSVYQKESDCVLGLNCSRNYEEGLKMAKEQNKPLLIDFTGYACVNCRRMEENVWSDPEVYQLMADSFIVVSLYVDDKKPLPVSRQFTYTTKDGLSKEISTFGDLWATFQTENFSSNAQPLYSIVNTDEKLLNFPVGYTPDKKEYIKWLKCGLSANATK